MGGGGLLFSQDEQDTRFGLLSVGVGWDYPKETRASVQGTSESQGDSAAERSIQREESQTLDSRKVVEMQARGVQRASLVVGLGEWPHTLLSSGSSFGP